MTLIEELKTKMEAATVADCDLDQMPCEDAEFLFMSYHMMPALLDAVEALKMAEGIVAHAVDSGRPVAEHLRFIQAALAKFEGPK